MITGESDMEKPGVKQRRCDLMGSWGASPVQGNLHAGFLKEEEDGNILSLFNSHNIR